MLVVNGYPHGLSVAHGPHIGCLASTSTPLPLPRRCNRNGTTTWFSPTSMKPSAPSARIPTRPGSPQGNFGQPHARNTFRRKGQSRAVTSYSIRMEMLEEGVQARAVERLIGPAHNLHVLLRHRLLRQADRFEGFGFGSTKRPPSRSCRCWPSRTARPPAPSIHTAGPPVPTARRVDYGASSPKSRMSTISPAPVPEHTHGGSRSTSLTPVMPSVGNAPPPFEGSSESELDIGIKSTRRRHPKSLFESAYARRTISTFSCDIAYSDSPAAVRASSG